MFIPVGVEEQGEYCQSTECSRSACTPWLTSDIWQVDKDAGGGITRTKLIGVRVRLQDRGEADGSMFP